MAIPFSRSMRSLEQDRFVGAGWILIVGLVILGAWLVWFFAAEIRLYEVTERRGWRSRRRRIRSRCRSPGE